MKKTSRLNALASPSLYLRNHQTASKPFKCDECSANFTMQCALDIHRRCHSKTVAIDSFVASPPFLSCKEVSRHENLSAYSEPSLGSTSSNPNRALSNRNRISPKLVFNENTESEEQAEDPEQMPDLAVVFNLDDKPVKWMRGSFRYLRLKYEAKMRRIEQQQENIIQHGGASEELNEKNDELATSPTNSTTGLTVSPTSACSTLRTQPSINEACHLDPIPKIPNGDGAILKPVALFPVQKELVVKLQRCIMSATRASLVSTSPPEQINQRIATRAGPNVVASRQKKLKAGFKSQCKSVSYQQMHRITRSSGGLVLRNRFRPKNRHGYRAFTSYLMKSDPSLPEKDRKILKWEKNGGKIYKCCRCETSDRVFYDPVALLNHLRGHWRQSITMQRHWYNGNHKIPSSWLPF